jgi:hypothetical protein
VPEALAVLARQRASIVRASIVLTNVMGSWAHAFELYLWEIAMFDDAFTRRRTIGLIIALTAALSLGLLLPKHARAEGPDEGADLTARFQSLSQHGNVECSAQFEKAISTMPPDGKLQGSCCAPMDEARLARRVPVPFRWSLLDGAPRDSGKGSDC